MLTAETSIVILKAAVTAVTLLLATSLLALSRGRYRLHGRINMAVFVLTLGALLGLEVLARLISPQIFDEFFTRTNSWNALYLHLGFSIPTALILPFMLWSGLTHRRGLHVPLGIVFLLLWLGTFVTGVFGLPHGE